MFGVPSFVVDEEVFWGNDSIDYLHSFLENKDILDREKYKSFTDSIII